MDLWELWRTCKQSCRLVDLTHPLSPDTPRWDGFPAMEMEPIYTHEKDGFLAYNHLIAGQFGAHLPAESLTGTGILPEEVSDRLKYVGNTSRTGAYMALMSGDVKKEVETLSHEMDYMELGATENYEQLFTRCLMFPSAGKRR